MIPADRYPLTWAQVQLSVHKIEFDNSCLVAEVQIHCSFKATTKDSLIRIKRDGCLIGIVNQGRFRLLEAEYRTRRLSTYYPATPIPGWITHVEKHQLLTPVLAWTQGGPGL